MARKTLPTKNPRSEVDAFLETVGSLQRSGPTGPRGRLLFALDATASRERTWDQASEIQATMFVETARLGGLDVRLCYYQGFGRFYSTSWLSDPDRLGRAMSAVRCEAGITQIEKVLRHALGIAGEEAGVNALIFVGDALEEALDGLAHLAGQLRLLGCPLFMFHEGADQGAALGFEQLAKVSGGAFCRFDSNSPQMLRDLLQAVAVFAAGGQPALEQLRRQGSQVAGLLTRQMGNP